MKLMFVTAVAMLLAAGSALAQDDPDIAYMKKMQGEAQQYMADATAASDAGDDAGVCEALKQAIISLTSGYVTAGALLGDLQDEGASGDDIDAVSAAESDFLEQRAIVGKLAAGCV